MILGARIAQLKTMSSDELTTIAQKAAQGGLSLFIGNASSIVILAVGAIIVARLLGSFSFGLYTLAVAIPALLVALAGAGMNFALVRLPARLRSEGDHARANRLAKLGFSSNLQSAQRPQSSAMLAQRNGGLYQPISKFWDKYVVQTRPNLGLIVRIIHGAILQEPKHTDSHSSNLSGFFRKPGRVFPVEGSRRLNARRAMKTATTPSKAKEQVQRTPVNVGSDSWGVGSRGRSFACFAHSIAAV